MENLVFLSFSLWRCHLYRKLVSATYVINIIFQAFITLLLPAGLFFLCSWLLVRYAGAPTWIYAPLLIVGILIGLFSMVKFIISAMSALERLEDQSKQAKDEVQSAERKRDKLSRELDALRDESDPAKASQAQDKD